jgi:large subunit ribosomal protein L19
MATKLDIFNQKQLKTLPDIRPGYTVVVHQKIKEGNKERIQPYKGIVIARKHGKGINATITVRKISGGIGVEKIFPIHSPVIEKIEVLAKAKVRRAKLYFLRERSGKSARLKAKSGLVEAVAPVVPLQTGETPTEENKEL